MIAAFAVADEEGLLLLDLDDLRSMLRWLADNAGTLSSAYGNISGASVGAIQRRSLVLEEQGADRFFGEQALAIGDLMQRDFSGNGVISVLHAARLTRETPRLYAAFLMWLLSELFEELPEVDDPEVPELVLFFDEAHLLFKGMPRSLLEKIEQVVRLVRSKGVGVYFVTQSPLDIPATVLGQLGLKVQHALRAFTPADRKTLKAIADGAPGVGAVTLVKPPESQIGPISPGRRAELMQRSPMRGRCDTELDRESAYELLTVRAERAAAKARHEEAAEAARKSSGSGGVNDRALPKPCSKVRRVPLAARWAAASSVACSVRC